MNYLDTTMPIYLVLTTSATTVSNSLDFISSNPSMLITTTIYSCPFTTTTIEYPTTSFSLT